MLSPLQLVLEGGPTNFPKAFNANDVFSAMQTIKRPDINSKSLGRLSFGPVIGSQHTSGAQFYFPARRPESSPVEPQTDLKLDAKPAEGGAPGVLPAAEAETPPAESPKF